MGIFDRFMKPQKNSEYLDAEKILKVVTGYTPRFTNWNGCIYESELVRSAIDARARHISKLKAEILGTAQSKLTKSLKKQPNKMQTWSQFLYRASTILDCTNTLFIIPILGQFNETLGYIPLNPIMCELVKDENDNLWLRYNFSNGQMGAIEWDRVCILVKHQFKSDFFGDTNDALNETMQLIHIQNQAIEEGAKNAATFRFMAKLTNFSKTEDLKKEQQRFAERHLQADDGNGGMLLFPNNYDNIQQIESKPFTVDAEQMKLIQTNVYNYFGVNEDILQNKAFGDSWSAFYEGAVEPFSIQLSEALTKTIYSEKERELGNEIIFTSNRLQYLSNADKLAVSRDMLDRGVFTLNQVLDMWNMPHIEGEEGDRRFIRGEYYDLKDKVSKGEKGKGNE